MHIRALDPLADRALVTGFFIEVADYIRLERDADPDAQVTDEFFTDAPPGCDPAASHRLGLFAADRLIGIAEMAPGYPEASDAYLGLMLVSALTRGKGAGVTLLRHLEDLARSGGARQLFLAVLDANPKGRAFWEREGFRLARVNGPVTLGQKTQLAHRMVKTL